MEFVRLDTREEFSIDAFVSLHYFEFARDFIFKGESHDFWEFLYVDKGEAEVMAGTSGYALKQGDLIFHQPDEFHSVWANSKIAPNIVVASFVCTSKAMDFFRNKIFAVGNAERNMIVDIVKEGFQAFLPPFDDPSRNTLVRRYDGLFGAEQMMKINLQTLLISLTRKKQQLENAYRLSTSARERLEDDIIRRLETHLEENAVTSLTLSDVCGYMKMSRTHLMTLFKLKKGIGIIEYFKDLKIEQAKELLREKNYNVTQIAEYLGYSSIHSFSRHFKKVTDMSPTEYSKSVKSRL